MQPRVVKMYIEAMDKIASEFVQRVNAIRDTKNEMPEDFKNEMNKWALESVAYIALNQRLGLLGPTDKNSKGQQLIEVGATSNKRSNKISKGSFLCRTLAHSST